MGGWSKGWAKYGMPRHIDIVAEIALLNEVFNEAREGLSGILLPGMSYQVATTEVIKMLTIVASHSAVPEHPIKVLLDIYPDAKMGRLTAHGGEAWMVLSLENTLPTTWETITAEGMATVVFRLTQAFTHEIQHYRQYLQNWMHFEKTGIDAPEMTHRSDAANAARELIAHYGTARATVCATKMSIDDASNYSETMARVVRGASRETVKRFLSALYIQLQGR